MICQDFYDNIGVMISFDEFKKVDLRTAKIISAEAVEGSEKLLKLRVDLGEEKRQIVAGIAKQYKPEELFGREIVVVANLESRVLFGLESQGMLLAAGGSDGPVLLRPDRDVLPGARVS